MRENEPLLNENPKEKIDCIEKNIECFAEAPRPISYFFQSGIARRFQFAIENDECISREAMIAYRGDPRPPTEIFSKGFSAYTKDRPSYCCTSKTCSNHFDRETIGINICIGMMLLPCFLPCFCLNALRCINSYFPNQSGNSPGGCFGQNKIDDIYVSNWSSLALSKVFEKACPYRAKREETFWRYIILLPDGHIDFSQFCHEIKSNYPTDFKEPRFQATGKLLDSTVDVSEIFPYGPQRISSKNIIAAIKISYGKGMEEVTVNSQFTGYQELVTALNDQHELSSRISAIIHFAEKYKNRLSSPPALRMTICHLK